jgi:hypothetical protein
MTAALAIIGGASIIVALLAIPARLMVLDLGWKAMLKIWCFSILATAIACSAALLIGYGVERL